MRCRSEVNIPEAGEARTKQACCSPQRRRDRRAHATTASWWNGMESELRSDWQAEARPTKAVRAALGWTGRRPIPQCSDEESMSCEEVSGEEAQSHAATASWWNGLGNREQTCPHGLGYRRENQKTAQGKRRLLPIPARIRLGRALWSWPGWPHFRRFSSSRPRPGTARDRADGSGTDAGGESRRSRDLMFTVGSVGGPREKTGRSRIPVPPNRTPFSSQRPDRRSRCPGNWRCQGRRCHKSFRPGRWRPWLRAQSLQGTNPRTSDWAP